MIRRSIIRHGIAALALAIAIVPLSTGSAGAVSGLPITCTAAGTVLFQNGSSNTAWQLIGKGSCQGDLEGTYFLDFTGTGTSDSLGNCDAMNGGFIVPVTNLDIHIVGTLTNAGNGLVKPVNQHWAAPLTTSSRAESGRTWSRRWSSGEGCSRCSCCCRRPERGGPSRREVSSAGTRRSRRGARNAIPRAAAPRTCGASAATTPAARAA